MTETRGTVSTAQDPAAAQVATAAPGPKLADPPIPGGRVEAMMGMLIRVLAHSPLARPLPAVSLSALGLGLVAFMGCVRQRPIRAGRRCRCCCRSPRWRTGWGAPALSPWPTNFIMNAGLTLCCLGLAGMLWANSHGWCPDPRKIFWTAAAVVAVLVNITPVGSSDVASYATYRRIAALGHNPRNISKG